MNQARILFLAATSGRVLIAGLLFIAATPKLLDPASFALSVANYRLASPLGNYVIALWLPWLECVVALALLVGPPTARRGAWLLGIVLSGIFLVAVASAWLRGLDIACGCFGGAEKITLRDVLLRLALQAGTIGAAWSDQASARTPARP